MHVVYEDELVCFGNDAAEAASLARDQPRASRYLSTGRETLPALRSLLGTAI
jgi:hypothetical protein